MIIPLVSFVDYIARRRQGVLQISPQSTHSTFNDSYIILYLKFIYIYRQLSILQEQYAFFKLLLTPTPSVLLEKKGSTPSVLLEKKVSTLTVHVSMGSPNRQVGL